MVPFSVLMAVYEKDQPVFLEHSLDSILKQTILPQEILLVQDGPLTTSLLTVIEAFKQKFNLLKTIELPENKGLGVALAAGLEACSFDLVARMDADDICYIDRFEKQLNFLQQHPQVAVVGTFINEFIFQPGDLNKLKTVPKTHDEILVFSRFRNPLNHPTVMFRKAAVLSAGNYLPMPLFEDYFLWMRLLHKGYQMANIQEPLLYFRFSEDALKRRHGLHYIKKEFAFLYACYQLQLFSTLHFYKVLIMRLPLRLLPKFVLKLLYRKVLRT